MTINPIPALLRYARRARAALNRAHLLNACTYWDAEVVRLGQELDRAREAYAEAIAARAQVYDALDHATSTQQPHQPTTHASLA